MKTKYTRNQIQESIKYWSRILESIESEENLIENLKEILFKTACAHKRINDNKKDIEKYVPTITDRKLLDNGKFPSSADYSSAIFEIHWQGKANYNMASDVYIKYQEKTSGKIVIIGIEEKESKNSKMFSPRISYENGKITYQNKQISNQTQLTSIQNSIIPDKAYEKMANYADLLMTVMNNTVFICSKGQAKWRIKSFPASPISDNDKNEMRYNIDTFEKKANHSFSDSMHTLDIYKNRWPGLLVLAAYLRELNDAARRMFVDDAHGISSKQNLMIAFNELDEAYDAVFSNNKDQYIKRCLANITRHNSYSVSSVTFYTYISDSKAIGVYFNTARQDKSRYLPVQYIHQGDTLYSIDDSCNFFSGNNDYKVLKYDDAYNRIKVSWSIHEPNAYEADAFYIDGKVFSVNITDGISLSDKQRLASVNADI